MTEILKRVNPREETHMGLGGGGGGVGGRMLYTVLVGGYFSEKKVYELRQGRVAACMSD